MAKKRIIDMHGLLYDCDLVDALGERLLWLYPLLWSLAEDWGGYEPKYATIALETGALRMSTEEVQTAINTLISHGKIIPYTINGRTYHWIKNFLRHQNLNNPTPPRIPLPPWITYEEQTYSSGKTIAKYRINLRILEEHTSSLPVDYQEATCTLPVLLKGKERKVTRTRKGRENKGGVIGGGNDTPHPPDQPTADVADSPTAISDPPSPDDSLNDDNSNGLDPFLAHKRHNKSITATDVGTLWNRMADPVLPRIITPVSDKRKKAINRILKKHPHIEWWQRLFQAVNESPFLLGINDRGFRGNFDFVLRNYERIIEGNYQHIKRVEDMPKWKRELLADS